MHYQIPENNINELEEYDVPYSFRPFNDLPNYYRFSASVALFGGLLKKSISLKNLPGTNWPFLQKRVMIRMMFPKPNICS